jgi:hypothetical protein
VPPFQREFESDFTDQDVTGQQIVRHEHEATRAAIGKISDSLFKKYDPVHAATGFSNSSLYKGLMQFFRSPTDQLNQINRGFRRSSTDSQDRSDPFKRWADTQGRMFPDRSAVTETVAGLIGKLIALSPIYYWGPNIVRFEAAENRLFPSGSWRAPLRTNPVLRLTVGSPLARASVLPVFTASLLSYEYYARSGRELQERESQRLPGTRANDDLLRARNYLDALRNVRDANYERVFSARPDDDVISERSDEILDGPDDERAFSARPDDAFGIERTDGFFNGPGSEQTFSTRQNDNASLGLNAGLTESFGGPQVLDSSVSMSDSGRPETLLDN